MAMPALWQDIRYGVRGAVSRPGFSLLAVLTLALGIGAATTIFSVIQNVLLDPFPYLDARRVVAIQIHDLNDSRPGGRTFLQAPEFLDYQEQSSAFEDVIGGTTEDVLLTTGDSTELLSAGLVTSNLFTFLGVPAAVGRGLTPDDAKPDATPVFVMAYKLWFRLYNLDPSIVGRTFTLNGVPTRLVGIMPKRFTKLAADLWRPVSLSRTDPAVRDRYFMFQARLKPGVSLRKAEADLEVVARRAADAYPTNYPKQFHVNVIGWVASIVGQFGATLYTLAGAVGLLLLIACSNVTNMLLARAASREKEMAIRSAIGASRLRLVRQLLVESGIFALAGAALGCALAHVGLKGLVQLIPDGLIPREADIRVSAPVLAFSVATAAITSFVFGLVPALHTVRRNMFEPLKDAGKGVSGGFRGNRLRGAIVVAEVALSMMLLIGAGLLIRSFVRLQTVALGFNPDRVLVARLTLPRGQYTTAEGKQQFYGELLRRLHALPGVVSAAETVSLPPYGGIGTEIDVVGKTHQERWDAIVQLCSEGYFRTLERPMLRGRLLAEADVVAARRVAVVNQTLVNRFFGGDDPIGRQVRLRRFATLPGAKEDDAVFDVIGVVADAKNRGVTEPVAPELLVPYSVTGAFERGVLVRTQNAPEPLLDAVRREVWAVDRGVALGPTGTLNDYLTQNSYAEPRFSLVVLGVFAGVGLLLVSIGVYSVIAYTVARQTHEIGIRIALGASRGDVLKMVGLLGARLLAVGTILGLAGSLAGSRLIESQLWTVSPYDPLTFVLVAGLMTVIGLAACYFPARRAMRVNPIIALRYE
jgi:predicted permease